MSQKGTHECLLVLIFEFVEQHIYYDFSFSLKLLGIQQPVLCPDQI